MKGLIRIVLMLVVGILVYNYFFGSADEKAQSKEVFTTVKDLGKATWDLLKSEKEKFDEGKYDEAVDKIGDLLSSIKDKAEAVNDSGLLDQITQLEERQERLEDQAKERPDSYSSDEEAQKAERNIKTELRSLIDDTEQLMRKVEDQ